MENHYTIKEEDVGKRALPILGHVYLVGDNIGHILPIDIGKRIYYRNGIYQTENNEQRDRRTLKNDRC